MQGKQGRIDNGQDCKCDYGHYELHPAFCKMLDCAGRCYACDKIHQVIAGSVSRKQHQREQADGIDRNNQCFLEECLQV